MVQVTITVPEAALAALHQDPAGFAKEAPGVPRRSPVITLARVGALRLLERKDVRLVVPAEVVAEILAGPPGDAAREAEARKLALALGLDPEREVIAEKRLVTKKGATVVLQQPTARRKRDMIDPERGTFGDEREGVIHEILAPSGEVGETDEEDDQAAEDADED